MRFTMMQRAEPGTIFAEDAFDSQIGQEAPFTLKESDDGPSIANLGKVRLVGVTVLDEGRAAELEFEVVKRNFRTDVFEHFVERDIPMSFSFRELS